MIKPSLYVACAIGSLLLNSCAEQKVDKNSAGDSVAVSQPKVDSPAKNALDTAEYKRLMVQLSNNDTTGLWPAKGPFPLPGAVLPYNRIVAFYGNLYSTRMGILGELPKQQMLDKLAGEVKHWQQADSSLPVLPALHYVATTAQKAPGRDGKYRLRMPFHQIDTVVNWARGIDALTFLDIQIGNSSVKEEIVTFEKYLSQPDIHFGIDPEFSMKGDGTPGGRIGSFGAPDVNEAIDYLADLVRKNNLPPKILIVHRFTKGMLTGYENIKKVPEVQVVIDMDGWGNKVLKRSTWLRYIYKEPVMFTGFKIFYKNDTKTGADQLFTPEELVKFTPKPIYIQYQ